MIPPRVSVILPTYNRPELLHRALASLALQTMTEFEVIVVNDGGVDVAGVVDAWRTRLRLRHTRHSSNLGLPAARNTAIDLSTAPVLAFLDDDDLFLPRHLAAGLAALGDGDGAGVVYLGTLVSRRFVEPGETPGAGDTLARFDIPFDARLLQICNFIPVISALCRGLRESGVRFDTGAAAQEDWSLWLRLHRGHRVPFAFVPDDTTVYHRVPGEDSMTNTAAQREEACGRFASSYRRTVEAHPSGDPRVRFGRGCYIRYEELRAGRIRRSQAVPHDAYERFLRVMVDYLASATPGEARALAAVEGIFADGGDGCASC